MMDITQRLIVTAAQEALGTTQIDISGEGVDLADEWPRRRMIDLVAEATGVEVHPSQPLDVLRELAGRHGVAVQPASSTGKLIEEIFEATAESSIKRPTFVTGHPLDISPLARADRDDPARSPTATASSTTPSSSGPASKPSSGYVTPVTPTGAPSTRITCGRWSSACRPRAGSVSASIDWPCCWPV
jgi:hypothetical protein